MEGSPGQEDIAERAERYIKNLREALRQASERLEQLKGKLPIDAGRLLENASAYASDAEYYLAKGDAATALVSASYAEGLLDSLRFLGLLDVSWPRSVDDERRVVVAGTFDIVHPGHLQLLSFASRLGKLYVIVARDNNASRDKGRPTLLDEQSRLQIISSIRFVYRAALGDEKDYLKPIEEIRPDYIVLGPDQAMDEGWLANEVERRTGKRPTVIRFDSKKEFSGGLRGSSDIIRRACKVAAQLDPKP
jgi:FAD synthetase